MGASAAEDYCRIKAAPAGSIFYYCTLYIRPEQKRAFHALHSFGIEVAEVLAECADPGIARIKLAWWQDEIQRLYNHQSRHPVSHELQPLIDAFPLEQNSFRGIIRHYEQRLNQGTQPLLFDELHTAMSSGPGELWKLTATLCGVQPQHTETWKNCGALFGIFELLHQRPLLMIENPAAITRQLQARLETALPQLPPDKSSSNMCILIMARIVLATCHEMLEDEDRLLREKVSLTPLRKFWIAWRTKRQVMSHEG